MRALARRAHKPHSVDAEATLASLVASIGHPLKKQECKTRKIQTAATPMPCKHQLCKPICTEKQQSVDLLATTFRRMPTANCIGG